MRRNYRIPLILIFHMVDNTMELFIKTIMLGEAAVGKTSLTQRFIQNRFGTLYKATMGLDISVKEVPIQDKLVRVQVWDLGGHMMNPIIKKFYHGAQGAFLIFDLTRPQTLKKLHYWIDDIILEIGPRPLLVLGNKADITSYQMPKSQIAEELIQIQIKLGENYAGYFQTSAKTGDQVEMAFRDLIQIISKQILSQASYQDLFQDADDFSDIIEVPPPPELGGVTFPPP